jgi:prevent-host-death family protein
MSSQAADVILSVAEAKARFSEIIDRVADGERFIVTRRGRPALALVGPDDVPPPAPKPAGLLTMVGALADWDELPEVVGEIYEARSRARDRDVPSLD